MKKIFIILCMWSFIMTGLLGCNEVMKTTLTPEQLYSKNHSLDMFVYKDAAYVNVADVNWVKKETFEKENYIGKISNSGIKKNFNNWDATILPVGSEIYTSNDPQILLARLGTELIPYMKYVEG